MPPVYSKENYCCNKCGEHFKHSSSHSRHLLVCGKEKEYKCGICSKAFARKDNYRRHEKTCQPKTEKQCPHCNKVFLYQSLLDKHMYQVHDNDRFVCLYCTANFSKNKLLIEHRKMCGSRNSISMIESHESPEPDYKDKSQFKCQHCSISFPSEYKQRRHQKGCSSYTIVQPLPETDKTDEQEVPDLAVSTENEVPFEISDMKSVETRSAEVMHDSLPPVFILDDDNFIDFQQNEVRAATIISPTTSDNSIQGFSGSAVVTPSKSTTLIPQDSPNTFHRKRVRRIRTVKMLVEDISEILEDCDENTKTEVLAKVTKAHNLNEKLFQKLKMKVKVAKGRGRKPLPDETLQHAWEFWHASARETTITTRPALQKVSRRSLRQASLRFLRPVQTVINKRGIEQYSSLPMITESSYHTIHQKYIETHPDHPLSYGVFIDIKPFYVRCPNSKDIESCLCKDHLHARRIINALLALGAKQTIPYKFPFNSYETFFEWLAYDCDEGESEYLDWKCTPPKKRFCRHQEKRWNQLKKEINTANLKFTVTFHHFIQKKVDTKDGKKERLTSIAEEATIFFILQFIDDNLTNIIHHRNQLKNFRTLEHQLLELLDCIQLHVDFSENLKLQLPQEIQSYYWVNPQLTIHSSLGKERGRKLYLPHLSEDRKHDSAFVRIVLEETIANDLDVASGEHLALISDNCTGQYKSGQHFRDLVELAQRFDITIIRIWSVAGHGKNEVDGVGGLAKQLLRKAVERGHTFYTPSECIDYLRSSFNSDVVEFKPQLVEPKVVADCREERKYLKPVVIKGSSAFRVLIIKPGASVIKSCNYLCVCDSCKVEIGSCERYQAHNITTEIELDDAVQNENIDDDLEDEDDLVIDPSQLLPDEQCHEYAYDNIFELLASMN